MNKIIVVDGRKAVVILPKTSPEEFQARVRRELLKAKYHEPPYRWVNQKGR
jgi:hypothetical protein